MVHDLEDVRRTRELEMRHDLRCLVVRQLLEDIGESLIVESHRHGETTLLG